MSKLLVQLLGVQERKFREFIDRLETMSLRPSIDIKLAEEISKNVRTKISYFNLDHTDTAPKELYFALRTKVSQDDATLANLMKVEQKRGDSVSGRIARVTTKMSSNEKVLCLTVAGTKKMLTAVPPKRTLRVLKYRSLAAVIKREDPRLLYAVAALIEDASWRSQIHAKMHRSNTKDIAWQSAEILALSESWYEKVKKVVSIKGATILAPEVGVVCLLPIVNTNSSGSLLYSIVTSLHSAQKLAVDSLPYRRSMLEVGLQSALPEIARAEQPSLQKIHGLQPSWRAVYEMLGSTNDGLLYDETSFIVDDVGWESTEQKLSKLLPQMDFWLKTHYLGMVDGAPVSLHLHDVVTDLVRDSHYEQRSYIHFEASLWNELQIRYLQHDVFNKALRRQLLETNKASMIPLT